jgi:xanthine dehydrogenase YagR molybdenum-binding subunit
LRKDVPVRGQTRQTAKRPVNADVDQVQVILVSEVDHDVNPVGVKGLGELANVGTAAAIANAVHNATGIRVRKLPIRLEKLLQA